MSNGSAMAPGGIIHDIIGSFGTREGAGDILQGQFDVNQPGTIDGISINTLKGFVKQMARPRDASGAYIPDME